VVKKRIELLLVAIGIATVPALAIASETIVYSYDAKGRLVQVTHSGSVNNGVTTNYTYDRADNRNQVVTTGVP